METLYQEGNAMYANAAPLRTARWVMAVYCVLALLFGVFSSMPTVSFGISNYFTMVMCFSIGLPILMAVVAFLLTKVDNTYIKQAGWLLLAVAIISVAFALSAYLINWTNYATIGLISFIVNFIEPLLLITALVAFLRDGNVDTQAVYILCLINVAMFGIFLAGRIAVTLETGAFSLYGFISVVLTFLTIKQWWRLLGSAKPYRTADGESMLQLFNNPATIGFVIVSLALFGMLFILVSLLA